MQDRFRFRVWDKFCETWLTDFAINQDGEINKFFNSEEALKRRFVLMQSTGLKDKNGKLIYEGDIVTDGYCVATIKYNHYLYNLMALVGGMNDYFPLEGLCYSGTKDTPFEVIGNIYENTELLEV